MIGGFLAILIIIYVLPLILPRYTIPNCSGGLFSIYSLVLGWFLVSPYISNLIIDFLPFPIP